MAKRITQFSDLRKPQRKWRAKTIASATLTSIVAVIAVVAYLFNEAPDSEPIVAPGTTSATQDTEPRLTSPETEAEPSTLPSAVDAPVDTVTDYRVMLSALDVKGRAPSTGYDRDLFGTAWTDAVEVEFGRNGCDTRNDILRRDLSDFQIREGTQGCLVESGTLEDSFSGEEIPFLRGRDTSSDVQIDHIVALSDSWQKGAQQWDETTRKNFANDPDNLLAVKGRLNQQKGAGDAATWLPPNRAFRCDYAKSIITVKDRYGIWVTAAEHDALGQQLDTCRG